MFDNGIFTPHYVTAFLVRGYPISGHKAPPPVLRPTFDMIVYITPHYVITLLVRGNHISVCKTPQPGLRTPFDGNLPREATPRSMGYYMCYRSLLRCLVYRRTPIRLLSAEAVGNFLFPTGENIQTIAHTEQTMRTCLGRLCQRIVEGCCIGCSGAKLLGI